MLPEVNDLAALRPITGNNPWMILTDLVTLEDLRRLLNTGEEIRLEMSPRLGEAVLLEAGLAGEAALLEATIILDTGSWSLRPGGVILRWYSLGLY